MFPELMPVVEGPRRDHLRRVERAAVREDVRHDHVGRREHDSEENRDERNRQLQRQRDVPELAQPRRAVDRGGVVDLLRDRRDSGDEDHRRERDRPPCLHGDDRRHRTFGVPSQFGLFSGVDDVQLDQEPVEDGRLRVVEPEEADAVSAIGAAQGRRIREAEQPAPAERAHERVSEQAGADDRRRLGDHA